MRKLHFIRCNIISVNLEKVNFFKKVTFKESLFCDSSENKKLSFDSTTFYAEALFKNIKIDSNLIFTNINFHKLADFSTTEDLYNDNAKQDFHEISFLKCIFQEVNFTNRKFKSKTDFSFCIFNRAPYFFGCSFHQYTIFPPQNNFKDIKSENAAHAYRVLYRGMSALRDRGYESLFYALVQKSERKGGQQPYHVKLASWLYEKTTNYGQSIGLPLIYLLIITIGFSLIYSLLSSSIIGLKQPIDWDLIGYGFDTSIEQIVKPFKFYTEKTEDFVYVLIKNHPAIFKLLAIIQTVLSLSLITLFLLSLRWKFKRD